MIRRHLFQYILCVHASFYYRNYPYRYPFLYRNLVIELPDYIDEGIANPFVQFL